ncbi:MAG: deoxyribodipyrimidine photo-lyase [Pseudomonadota bacterium]|nr:deoxyribodipyrimidine photo-lyase [Pseudomonadota bacterium]
METQPIIVWLRRDLRLADNPAMHAARESGAPVVPVFVFDEEEAFAPGGAAKWWLHRSLRALSVDLTAAGSRLVLRRGRGAETVAEIARSLNASAVFWNRRYAPAHVAADKKLKADLTAAGVEAKSFSAALLREPWEVETKAGAPFRVYSPFWKVLRAAGPSREARPSLRKIRGLPKSPFTEDLDSWGLQPVHPDWAWEFAEVWRPGEAGAHEALKAFLDETAEYYARDRDRPDREATSRLSPHLAFGEISPLQVWRATHARIEAGELDREVGEKFLSEIGWREFSYHLLYFNEGLEAAPLRAEFAALPWRKDKKGFAAWTKGETGFPVVDAGMRQLWRTGWMHNRVRMLVASFLVKDLLIPWQDGASWFWDTLVDADPANNSASWQWVAGCGADAAPFFRIFNPVTQGEKFDPHGAYVRRFVLELSQAPDKFIHKPWEAPKDDLASVGVTLGKTYPARIVDHAFARTRALEAFRSIRKD